MIRFGYFGQFFHGLQPQKDVPTAGGALRDLIAEAAGMPPKALCFSARTDKGVHAIENIATFWFPNPFDTNIFLQKISQASAVGLRNISCFAVTPKTHARGNAVGKHYRYVLNGKDPETSWQIIPDLDIKVMREALSYIVGEHDFSSFRSSGCTAGTPVKVIYEVRISQVENQGEYEIQIDLYGNAFLRQMIRILVGLLCEIGTGLRPPDAMRTILETKTRQAAGITAPACGLSLLGVELKGLGALGT